MSEIKKVASRDSYGNALVELGRLTDKFVVLDADLAAATKTGLFKKEFPDRFFECGIAEANMIDVAAGISTFDVVPFVSSFAMFAAGRAYEQIRNTIGYPHLNVKICATHGGISVGEDGASHQCCEDFGLMRTIPGMVVMCPSDDIEARKMIRAAFEFQGPVYIRFSRYATPTYHADDYDFKIGKGEIVRAGSDVAIIATGIMVAEAVCAAEILAGAGIDACVVNMPTIKPLDENLVYEVARKCGKILTVEEHSVIGGLGEAVCSFIAEKNLAPVKRLGLNDEFGHSGTAANLLKDFGLNAESIAASAKNFVNAN